MPFFEEVTKMSETVSIAKMVQASLLFFNSHGIMSHYRALEAIGLDLEIAKKMDDHNVIWYWGQWLLVKGFLKKGDKETNGELAIKVAN